MTDGCRGWVVLVVLVVVGGVFTFIFSLGLVKER